LVAAALAGFVRAGNNGLTGGLYGGTLGAGGACGAERAAFGGNPAALDPGSAGLGLQFHRPFGLEDAGVAEAAAFWDLRRLGASLAWRQTEVDRLFSEQGWEYRQSYRVAAGRFGRLDLGGAWTYWSQSFPGQSAAGFGQGYGICWQVLPRLKAGAFAAGLPFDPRADFANEAVYQWGFEARSLPRPEDGFPAQTAHLDFRKTGETPWRAIASLSLSPHRSLQVSAGLSTEPFQASLGVKLRWAGFETSQAYRYHRYLGGTFFSGLGFYRRQLDKRAGFPENGM
jgi:hypothetical protein